MFHTCLPVKSKVELTLDPGSQNNSIIHGFTLPLPLSDLIFRDEPHTVYVLTWQVTAKYHPMLP